MNKSKNYWTKENCRELCIQINSIKELKIRYQHVYRKILKDYPELLLKVPKLKADAGFWKVKENVLDEAKKYRIAGLFKAGSKGAWNAAMLFGWYEEATSHMVKPRALTKAFCVAIAKTCKTRSELLEKDASIYRKAIENDWEECFDHMERLGSRLKRAIYVFIFADKHAYVGLSYNIAEREKRHMADSSSCVYKHYHQNCKEYELKRLSDYVEVEEAVQLEEYFLEEYTLAYTMLNKAKTGGLGGDTTMWDEDTIWEEVIKYRELGAFSKGSPSAYAKAQKLGMLKDVRKVLVARKKPVGYYTVEMINAEVAKYGTYAEFEKNSPLFYKAAGRLGIRDEVCKYLKKSDRKPSGYYKNEENCIRVAKQCNSRKELSTRFKSAYELLKMKGLLDSVLPLVKKPQGYWRDKETNRKEAKKFQKPYHYRLANGAAYEAARKMGWLDEFFPKKGKDGEHELVTV